MKKYKINKNDGTSLSIDADRFTNDSEGNYNFFAGESLVYFAEKSRVQEVLPITENEEFTGYNLIRS